MRVRSDDYPLSEYNNGNQRRRDTKRNMGVNELESLGVTPKVENDLNDIQETSNLAENLKQAFYQAYKEAYNDSISY